ncbi:MAG: flippase-like domain-containing protein [Candidatus Eisenbacteria bacterium]|nr:flippase-like domain-containing protein [Candidatus Eisenbacteria bacterium]
MEIVLQRKSLLRGIRLFLVLTILGIAAVFYLTGSGETLRCLARFHLAYLGVAVVLIAVDLFAGAARIHIFTRRLLPRGFWACFKANLANIFLAAATPFQTGGGAAQLYVLNRYGVPYAAGVCVSVLNFCATLSFLLLCAVWILNVIPSRLPAAGPLLTVLDVSRATFYVTLALFILLLVKPILFGRMIARLLALAGRILPRHSKRLGRWSASVLDFLNQYATHVGVYWREGRLTLVWNYLLTVVLYFNKCLVAYVIVRGLGIHAGFWEMVMLQMLIIFFLYFAPTPGASFIAETGIAAVMALVLPKASIPVFAVLWRFVTTYFGVLLGALVLLGLVVEKSPRESAAPAGVTAPSEATAPAGTTED